MKRIMIFVGNYGSGKTELSLNYAIGLANEHKSVMLVDIDIVNPYFRSSEKKEMLNELGIRVICPEGANQNIDLPVLPREIYSAFDGNDFVIMDCGGDPAGASALGALKDRIDAVRDDVIIYFVLNVCRPLQKTAEEAEDMLRVIEHVSRQKVDGIINNTNLANETTVDELIRGLQEAKLLSERTGIPVAFTSCKKELTEEFERRTGKHAMPIEIYMRPYWQTEQENTK